jgi:hypothetical protein
MTSACARSRRSGLCGTAAPFKHKCQEKVQAEEGKSEKVKGKSEEQPAFYRGFQLSATTCQYRLLKLAVLTWTLAAMVASNCKPL